MLCACCTHVAQGQAVTFRQKITASTELEKANTNSPSVSCAAHPLSAHTGWQGCHTRFLKQDQQASLAVTACWPESAYLALVAFHPEEVGS